MAVWIFAYGSHDAWHGDTQESVSTALARLNSVPLNELTILHSIEEARQPLVYPENYRSNFEGYLLTKTDDELSDYRTLMHRPDADVQEIVAHFMAEGERIQRENKQRFENAVTCFTNGRAKAEWQYEGNGLFINKLCFFEPYDGLRLHFTNDLVWISGPFAVFSVYSTFLKTISTASRNYYHQYFSRLFRALGSDFIMYAHEWSGLENEDDREYNVAKLNEQSNWQKRTSDTIHTMESIYRCAL